VCSIHYVWSHDSDNDDDDNDEDDNGDDNVYDDDDNLNVFNQEAMRSRQIAERLGEIISISLSYIIIIIIHHHYHHHHDYHHHHNYYHHHHDCHHVYIHLGVEEAHMLEFQQFNLIWDKKMAEYELHAEELVEAMKERHSAELRGMS